MATPPPADISFTCTNEELFISLDKFTNRSPLPSNAIDVNPYIYEPQNLPYDFWFLSRSKGHTDIEHGLWKTREEALEVFSNSDIIGWRTTLEYYNGQVPYERKTNWVMQVFSTTQKRLCDENVKKESISLYRVFLVPGNEMQRNVSGARIDAENLLPEPPVLDANFSTITGYSSNLQVNKHDETEVSSVAERLPAPENQGGNNVEMEFVSGAEFNFFSGGDFLELNDLDNPASSSSSNNSTAASISSDECFDSMDFLQDPGGISSDECFDSMAFLLDLDQDQVLEQNDAGKKLNVDASNRLDEEVIVPATLGSLVNIEGSNSGGDDELFKTTGLMPNSASGSRNLNNKVTKRAEGNQRGEGSPPSPSPSSSSSDDGFTATGGRRKSDGFGRMKEIQKYLCFMSF